MSIDNNTVMITVEKVVAITDAAICVLYEGIEAWLPKSQLFDYDNVEVEDTDVDLEATQWILEEKGLI